jgi:hypothetical protein
MDLLTGLLYFAFDAAAILLLLATWQHTRITGFLVLAASYGLGILSRWLLPLLSRLIASGEPDAIGNMALVYQATFLLVSLVGLYGLWDVYQQLKRRPAVAPSVD